MREKLDLNVVPIQLNIGAGEDFIGVIDLITMKAMFFGGDDGSKVEIHEIPEDYIEEAQFAREALIDAVSMHDDDLAELYLDEMDIPEKMLRQSIHSATVNRDIVPLMMGSAVKNQGIQPLLDAICNYLPNPVETQAFARDHDNEGAEVPLSCDPTVTPGWWSASSSNPRTR